MGTVKRHETFQSEMQMKTGFGPVEWLIFKMGGTTAIISLLIVYLPQLVGSFDFGAYGPAVGLLVAGVVQILKSYVVNNPEKVEEAVHQDRIEEARKENQKP